MNFKDWSERQGKNHPQFRYWDQALQLELLLLKYIKSLRIGDFQLYIKTTQKMAPWLFSLDHHNYARWLPVHIRDMVKLKDSHPDLCNEFEVNGNFVVKKSDHKFSQIALDQNHEQQNAIIKGEGGAVGLFQSDAALRRWLIAGPEVSRIIQEFETSFSGSESTDKRHHKQTFSVQMQFWEDVKKLVDVIDVLGSPYLDDGTELVVIDTKDVMNADNANNVYKIEDRYHSI